MYVCICLLHMRIFSHLMKRFWVISNYYSNWHRKYLPGNMMCLFSLYKELESQLKRIHLSESFKMWLIHWSFNKCLFEYLLCAMDYFKFWDYSREQNNFLVLRGDKKMCVAHLWYVSWTMLGGKDNIYRKYLHMNFPMFPTVHKTEHWC